MSQHERRYENVRQALKDRIGRLIVVAEAADADSWGADVFRQLLSYAKAVELDLDAGLLGAPADEEARRRLDLLGAELSLHQWVDVTPGMPDYTAMVADTLGALLALRDVVRARNSNATAT